MDAPRPTTLVPWLCAALLGGGCGRGGEAPPAAAVERAEAVANVATEAPGERAPTTPLVLIVIDTLRADALLDPADRYDTPHLDRLAADAIVFPRAFAHAPMTLPSHTSLFSSRPPLETGVLNNGQAVPDDLPLLAEWLAEKGYETRAVLSIGTLLSGGSSGLRRGFADLDARFWNLGRGEETASRLRESLAARDAGKPLFLFAHYADPHEPYDAHGTERVSAALRLDGNALAEISTGDSSQWLQTLELAPGRRVFELGSERAFSVRHFGVKHGDKELAATWEQGALREKARQARIVVENPGDGPALCEVRLWIADVPLAKARVARYALEVAYADRCVGELLEELRRSGLYERSLIVFTSDHGESLGEHDAWGHVERLTDDLLHVPLLVKLPAGDGRAEALRAAAAKVTPHADVVPTVLELLGLPPLPGARGVSLLVPHESVHVAETHAPEAKKTQFALRDERFKLIYAVDDDAFQMYDLSADPGELTDVFATKAGERADWPERLRALARASGPVSEGLDEATRRELQALGYFGEE